MLFSGRKLHGILDSARHVKGEEKRTTVLTLIKLRRLRVVLGEALVDDVDLARLLFSIVGRRGLSLPLGVLEAIDGFARGASRELEQAQLALRGPRAARPEPLDHPVRHLEPAVVGEPRPVAHVDLLQAVLARARRTRAVDLAAARPRAPP